VGERNVPKSNAAPRIVHRKNGGWLALSAASDPVKIGVLGSSHEEACARFHAARQEWDALLASHPSDAASVSTGSVSAASA
jgi:hypothetical protein